MRPRPKEASQARPDSVSSHGVFLIRNILKCFFTGTAPAIPMCIHHHWLQYAGMTLVLVLLGDTTASIPAMVTDDGYDVVELNSSSSTLQAVIRRRADAVIIPDGADPAGNEELLPVLRRVTQEAIIVVGRGGSIEVAQALLQGADAYLPVPVTRRKLQSHLRAVLRTRRAAGSGRIDSAGGSNGQPLPQHLRPYIAELTPVELRLFSALAQRDGAMVPADQLANEVWAKGNRRASLRFYIRRLRAKFGSRKPIWIDGRKGIGYRLEVQLSGFSSV